MYECNIIIFLKDLPNNLKLVATKCPKGEPYIEVVGMGENGVVYSVKNAPITWGRDFASYDYISYGGCVPFSFTKRAARNIIDMLTGDNTISEEINEDEKRIIVEYGVAALDEIKKEAFSYNGRVSFVTKEGLCEALDQCISIFLIAVGGEYDYKSVCCENKDVDAVFKRYFGIKPPKYDTVQWSHNVEETENEQLYHEKK